VKTPVQHNFTSSEGNICYFEWGERGSGSSILLLHATGFHARCWDKVVEAFPDDTHVIAVDQLGHGRSDSPVISDWGQIAGATAELIANLNINFAIAVGHSMGGHCLVQIAARSPDLVGRLVLIDPVIMAPEVYQRPPGFGATSAIVAKRRNSWSDPAAMFERFQDRHPYRLWNQRVLDDYCQYGLLPDGKGKFELACPPQTEGSVYATSTSVNPWPLIEKISCPVTILRAPQLGNTDSFDFASSPTPAFLADRFQDAKDILLDDLTHFMPMQDPARIAKLIAGG